MIESAVSRSAVVASAVAAAAGASSVVKAEASIRPFRISVPEAAVADLRRRIAATRWPDRETVTGRTQGLQLDTMRALVRHWGTGYDWRKAEARLNALPHFKTEIDGLDIHFIHVRSRNPDSLPIIMTHGWPGSVFEFLKTVGPLTDPASHGGDAGDAFDLILPSIPGFGFSGKPAAPGWGPDRIARAWSQLMARLGITRYVAQGGDWGAPIASAMARQEAPGLLGIHLNLPATVPPEVVTALRAGERAPDDLTDEERSAFEALKTFFSKYRGYAAVMGTRPQTVGYAVVDSPAGLAAWIADYNDCEPVRLLTPDDLLDNVSLHWLTGSGASSARIYWETSGQSVIVAAAQMTAEIRLPVAITVFPDEVYRAPETWARRAYKHLIYFSKAPRGGHFAAWEEPEVFSAELRAAFRGMRKA